MRNRFFAALAATAVMLVAGAGTASAATEFGDTCTAKSAAPGTYTLVTLSSPATDLSLTAPISGVITKVKVKNGIPFPFAIPTLVKVLRSAGGNDYTVVNQMAVQANAGQTTTDARMPVQAGDKLGLHGTPFSFEETPIEGFSLYCDEVPGTLGAALGDVGIGSTANFPPATEGRVPLAAVIEPDADNDGYGDETQDACPLSAATQGPCPLIVLDAVPLAAKNAVKVYVAASIEGPVSVTGTVNLGKGKKTTLKAAPKTAYPGKISSIKLKFNAKLKKRLKELKPSKKLTLKITASATNIAGQVTVDKAKAKLKGQA